MSKTRIKNLAKKIVKASHDYYNGTPSVSDKVWDAWFDELKKLDPDHPVVTGVGAIPVSEWKKVQHEVPMDSLNKVNTEEEFIDWVNTNCKGVDEFVASEKLDGISVSVKYIDGKFHQALSRGDGVQGEDISQNVKVMEGIPEKLKSNYSGHVRGEIILRKSKHKEYFPDYANPRNAASGIAKRYDGDGCEHLTVLFYSAEGDFKKESDVFKKIEKLGLNTPFWKIVDAKGALAVQKDYQDSTRESLDYDIDGMVYSVNDLATKIAMGDKGRGPAGSIAFKFEAPSAETIITKIVWQVGNTGRMTPVAHFKTVDLLGTKVSKASLYNYSYIKDLGVGVGATVIVIRANDVIPRVEEVVTPKNVEKFPDVCPECGTKTFRDGEYIRCPNKETCPPQVLGRVSTWVKELGIMEWGDKVVKKMIDAGLVEDVADIYKLNKDQIASLDKMGAKSADVLLKELDKYREVPLYNLIGGLGIDNVATSTVKLVMGAGHDSLDAIKKLSVSQLENIDGFGSIKAEAFYDGVHENEERIQEILDSGVSIKAKVKGVLSGKTFCFTGSSSKPRKVLQKIVEDAGGEVKKSVGRGLSYLVVADPSISTSKTKAAQKNNTRVLSEDEFLKMANHG